MDKKRKGTIPAAKKGILKDLVQIQDMYSEHTLKPMPNCIYLYQNTRSDYCYFTKRVLIIDTSLIRTIVYPLTRKFAAI